MISAWLGEEYGAEISPEWCGHGHSDPDQDASTTVAYRPFTALTYYILWLSSALSAKCAVLIHYATVVLGQHAPKVLRNLIIENR